MTDEELKQQFADLRKSIDEGFTALHNYVDERTREMETRLLRGFERWAIPYNSRVASAEIATRGFSDRLTALEERVFELEHPTGGTQ